MNEEAVKLRRARLAVVRYTSLAVLTYVSGWLDQTGDVALSDVKWNQWATLGIGAVTSALVALGAVLNSAYSQVGQQPGSLGQKLGDMVKLSTPIVVFFVLLLAVSARAQSLNKPLQSVDTVADLVARTPVTNERLLVSGWRTVGDWGDQRVVRHDPDSVATTNLGCVFGNAGTGRYLAEDCEDGEIDIRKFGIQAGSTNYAAANQAAWVSLVDYATEDDISAHKSIRIPVGTFYFEGPLNLYPSTATPGTSFDSGRIRLLGSGKEQSWIKLTSATNNGLVVASGRVFLRDFTIGSTAERKASRALVTDSYTGNGILIRQFVNPPYSGELRNVGVQEQPNAGLFVSGAVEHFQMENILSASNGGEGFVLTYETGQAGPWFLTWDGCRALSNGTGGWSITNAYNNVFRNCEAINNFGEANVRSFSGINHVFDNFDIECQDRKVSSILPLTTNTVVFGVNTFTVPGYDFAAAGLESDHYVIVSNSPLNSRAWRVNTVATDTVTVHSSWGGMVTESTTNDVSMWFTDAIPGLVLRGAINMTVIGGYFGTLPIGIVLANAPQTRIIRPYFVNASITNWVGSEGILSWNAGSTNKWVQLRNDTPLGFNHHFNRNPSLVASETIGTDSIWTGPDLGYLIVGPESGAGETLRVRGGESGASMLKMERTDLDETVGFSVSSSLSSAKLIIRDESAQLSIAGGLALDTQPWWFLGNDQANSFTYTNVMLSPGRRLSYETNVNGVDLRLRSGAGTGTGRPGWVLLGNFDELTSGTNVHSVEKDRLGVHPDGVKIQGGGITIGNGWNSRMALEVSGPTGQGFQLPRFDTTARDAVAWTSGDRGAMFNNTDGNLPQYWNGTNWTTIWSSGNLPTVAALSGGATSNFFRGDGTFTNVIAGAITADSITYSATNLYDDYIFPISTLNPVGPLTGPTIVDTSGRDSQSLAAVFNTGDVCLLVEQMSHTWVPGTTIYPHFHIEPQTTAALTNTIICKYSVSDIGTNFPAWTIETNTVVIAGSQQWKHLLMAMPTNGISMTGKTGPSTAVKIRYEWTTSSDVHVISADIHYRVRGSPVAYVAP